MNDTPGCEVCRAAVTGTWSPDFRVVATSPVGWLLCRCGACGTLWQSDERRFWPLDEAEARRQFPEEHR